MRRIRSILLAASLWTLTACSGKEAPLPPPPAEPAAPVAVQPETEPVIIPQTQPAASEPAVAIIVQSETTPPTEEKTHQDYPYGDTTPTWDPEKAAAYPLDEACTPAELLEKWLTVEGLTLRDLEERNCGQLVLTAAQPADGVQTINVCYERQPDGTWSAVPDLTGLPGHVGKNGICHNRVINSYTSPAGLWALGMAFGNAPEPEGLQLPWRDVTPESDWVCDPASVYFNTWQERDDPDLTETWDYDEGEHLADYPRSYAYSCVIEFNTRERDTTRGCAIFLHCGDDYTAGCVSLPREDLLKILLWLDPEQNPCILITGHQN